MTTLQACAACRPPRAGRAFSGLLPAASPGLRLLRPLRRRLHLDLWRRIGAAHPKFVLVGGAHFGVLASPSSSPSSQNRGCARNSAAPSSSSSMSSSSAPAAAACAPSSAPSPRSSRRCRLPHRRRRRAASEARYRAPRAGARAACAFFAFCCAFHSFFSARKRLPLTCRLRLRLAADGVLGDRAPQQVRVALVRHEPRRVLVETAENALLLLDVRLEAQCASSSERIVHLVATSPCSGFAALQRLRVGVGGERPTPRRPSDHYLRYRGRAARTWRSTRREDRCEDGLCGAADVRETSRTGGAGPPPPPTIDCGDASSAAFAARAGA